MIFTACPYCDESQAFPWEAGNPRGWFASRCPRCGKVMWFEGTPFGGTTITHEDFVANQIKPGDEALVEKIRQAAGIQSTIVYAEGGR